MMLKMLAQFIISGSIVVAATYIAPRFGQKWAGLLVAAPLLTLLTFIFLSINSTSGNLRDYLASALVFTVPAALFIGCLLLFSGRLNFIVNILCSAVVYAVVVLVIYKLRTA
jgi:uncharacterized membrane protein (GlpM family)